MDATQGQAMYDQTLAFHSVVNVGSGVLIKLDGHANGGTECRGDRYDLPPKMDTTDSRRFQEPTQLR